mmetsp:Transcript_46662/g.74631  ORF Transcript_46662/g.74631 Transcript_46662/m.74631 type:complete len:461 (+) Transcript_46662:1142-2524(+)
MDTSSCLMPALRQLSTARSLYLLPHTPVMAAHAWTPAPDPPRAAGPRSPSGHGSRSSAKLSIISPTSCGVGTISAMASRMRFSNPTNAPVSPKSSVPSSTRSVSSCRDTCALSGDASTASKVQKGNATDAGRFIQSGSLPRSSCRLRDLPPTISLVNIGEGTAKRPMNSRRLMAMPATPPGVAAPPTPPALPLVRLAAPPASTCTSKSSAAGDGLSRTACPASASISASALASNTVAKSTPSLRARTDTCDKMSGMSGVITAFTPIGMSSSPPTRFATSTVGCEYTLFCMSLRSSTTTTTPSASTGLMICHAPICARLRSTGSSARSICDNGAAAVPRTTSSLNTSSTWPSTPSRAPMVPAVACSAPMYRCEQSPSAFCTRSLMALACSAQSVPPPAAERTTPRHSRRQITSSPLPPVDNARFSSTSPVILSTSTGALEPMEPSELSTTCLTALSSAKSR